MISLLHSHHRGIITKHLDLGVSQLFHSCATPRKSDIAMLQLLLTVDKILEHHRRSANVTMDLPGVAGPDGFLVNAIVTSCN